MTVLSILVIAGLEVSDSTFQESVKVEYIHTSKFLRNQITMKATSEMFSIVFVHFHFNMVFLLVINSRGDSFRKLFIVSHAKYDNIKFIFG